MLGMPISPLIMAFPPLYDSREMAGYVKESFLWCWRRALRPPHPLLEDYYVLCPHFSLTEAEGAVADFELPEMVQVTFYAMLLNEAVELGVVCGFMAEGRKSALVRISSCGSRLVRSEWLAATLGTEQAAEYVRDHFRWTLTDPSVPSPWPLLSDYRDLCPRFDLGVAMRCARDSNIPEMVQTIFYAMVIDDTAEFGLSHRLTMDYFAHAAHIPEMVQAIFYAMVINNAAKLRILRKDTEECQMLDFRKLR
ncbi:hypothetical protein Cgig2_007639 [Carnegiea gigantea]|uniref:Uncharacterized protein n=1 Tax=Carnegiea gigantea TaxID=171969 RepID=A0A9Q1Q7X7_9CARY|nr:hypothetical protein Cgig2_007639 [Carnegiea gigantea]